MTSPSPLVSDIEQHQMILMRANMIHLLAGMTVAVIAAAGPAHAQYDRDGRYVPSPMGVPRDPYAAPVPTYPGTPGGTTGTPIWPRGTQPSPPPKVLEQRPMDVPPSAAVPTGIVPLSLEQCDEGWSKSTHVTPVEFRRRCALLIKRRDPKRQ